MAAADAHFCGQCGARLGERRDEPAAPRPPAARASTTGLVEGERKQLTVLFADVKGSMDIQEDLDPEVWAAMMGRFLGILAEGVHRFGGTVDKFTGDGIMAVFGAPVAQEDHARRACHAAWHLMGAIAAHADELRRSRQVDLHVRLGLSSGEAIVGRVGDDLRLDPTALGHAVSLAQRMEAMAEPGSTYLTDQTARLVEGWFELRDLGPHPVKGARLPVRVHALERPMAPAAVRGRRQLGSARLVGRDRELALLESSLAAASEGHGQVVGVVGEAGVGKSRLCEEFARSAAARGVTVRRTTGISHARDVALLPILILLRDYFGISETDSALEARTRLADRLLRLDPGLADALPALFDFLEIGDPQGPAPPPAPELRMRRVFQALRRVTERRSEREVLVLVLEDMHWFDPQSLAFIERLVESYPGSRTLVVANFRPEFFAPWMRHSYYHQLPLAPLRTDEVGELLGSMLGVDLSLAPVVGFVQERTGGNPFFVEELTRALVEDGTLSGTAGTYRLTRGLDRVEVPPSVQAVIAARIDRLETEQKEVLQTAAVIGRTFSAGVLAEVMDRDADRLDDALRALCAAELLQETGSDAANEYRFWHPLTQEVAYSSQLTAQRARLHLRVADALATGDSNHLDEQAALVATHYERAGAHLEAARWNARAAAWVLRHDVPEAVSRWRAVLHCLDACTTDGEATEAELQSLALGIRARHRLIQYGARLGNPVEDAERLFAEGRAIAERLDDIPGLGNLTQAIGNVYFWVGRFEESRMRFQEAAEISERSDDDGLRASLWSGPTLVYPYTGPLRDGLATADRALALSGGDPVRGSEHLGYSPLMRTLLYRAEILALMGRLEDARRDAGRARAIARERSVTEFLVWTFAVQPRIAHLTGSGEDLRAEACSALAVAEESGNSGARVVGLLALGTAELIAGRWQDAILALERGLAEAGAGRAHFDEARLLTRVAEACRGAGALAEAARAAERAVGIACGQGARVLECSALLARAQVTRAAGGRGDAVADDLHAALVLAETTGAASYVPFIREELGRLRDDRAECAEAARLYSAIGAWGHARRMEAQLTGPLGS